MDGYCVGYAIASLMDTLMTAQKVDEIGFQMVDEMGIKMAVLMDS